MLALELFDFVLSELDQLIIATVLDNRPCLGQRAFNLLKLPVQRDYLLQLGALLRQRPQARVVGGNVRLAHFGR